jgi:hypothetical protein
MEIISIMLFKRLVQTRETFDLDYYDLSSNIKNKKNKKFKNFNTWWNIEQISLSTSSQN